jgi:hypothetical protein
MAIAKNSNGGNGRRQQQRHDRNGQWRQQRNGRWDGSTIVRAMGDGGEKAKWWKMAMAATIAMGNGGGNAMDGGMVVQSRSAALQSP